MTWTTRPSASQLSLWPQGSLVTRRQHHANAGDAYHVRMGTWQWEAERALALERAGYKCDNCGSEARLVVHHRDYDRLGDEWPEDLRVLCWDCHGWEHER